MKSNKKNLLIGLWPLLFTLVLTVTAGAHPPTASGLHVAEVIASSLPTLTQSQIKQGPTPPPAALATPPARDSQSDSVGATVGEFRVDESGNATYSIPIQVSPGTAGMTPKLALTYNSRLASGPMGPGWSIEGASQIGRCRQSRESGDFMAAGVPVDGNPAPVNFTSSDRYCLDGVRLLVTSGTYGANGSVYSPETDPFTKVTASVSNVNAGPDSFTVKRKDGTTSTYGNTAASINARVMATINGQAVAISWQLARVQDSTGNYLDYLYTNQPALGQFAFATGAVETVLAQVNYTGHATTPVLLPYASVTFQYTTLSSNQARLGYQAGVPFLQSQQLASITVQDLTNSGNATLRYYQLSYGTSVSGSGLSQLTQVQECRDSSLGVCFPPTTFSWSAATNSFVTDSVQSVSAFIAMVGYKVADIDGDGRQDLVWAKTDIASCGLNSRLLVSFMDRTASNQLTLVTPNQGVICAPINLQNNDQAWLLNDLDGDGRTDLMMGGAAGSQWVAHVSVGRPAFGSPVFNTSSNWLWNTPITVPAGTTARGMAADVNGDGLLDFIFPVTPSISTDFSSVMVRLLIRQNNALVFSDAYALQVEYTDSNCTGNINQTINCDVNFFSNDPQHRSTVASDVDGDGRTDLTLIVHAQIDNSCSPICTIAPPLEPSFNPVLGESDQADSPPQTPNAISNKYYWYQFIANGTSWPAGYVAPILKVKQYWSQPMVNSGGSLPSVATQLAVVDITGDGLADLLYQDSVTPTTYWAMLNTGKGYQAPIAATGITNNGSLQLADLTGDGRPELAFAASGGSAFKAMSLQTSGNFSTATTVAGNGMTAGSTLGDWINLTGDLDGDGASDFLRLNISSTSSNLYASRAGASSRYRPRDVITGITNGLGATTTLIYQPLTNKGVYQRGSEGGYPAVPSLDSGWRSPVFDVLAPMYVVSGASSSAPIKNSVNEKSTVYYRYQGALMQGGGRGFMGFYTTWSFDANESATTGRTIATLTGYAQQYPFIGMPEVTLGLALSGAFIRGSDELDDCAANIEAPGYNCFAAVGDAPWPDLLQTGVMTSFVGQLPVCNGAGCAQIDTSQCTNVANFIPPLTNDNFTPPAVAGPVFSYFSQRHETALDPDNGGAGIGNVAKLAQIHNYFCYEDGYGNLTHSTVITKDASDTVLIAQKRLTNSYNNDTNQWYLGRLTNSSVEFRRPGQPTITRTSSYTYDPNTGLLTSERNQAGGPIDQDIRTRYVLDAFGNRTAAFQCSADLSDAQCTSTASVQQQPTSSTRVHRYAKTTYDSSGRYPTDNRLPFYSSGMANQLNEQIALQMQGRDEFGNVTQQTSINGLTQITLAGHLGRPYFVADSTGKASTTTYQWCNNVSCPNDAVFRSQTVTAGAPSSWGYFDKLGRPVLEVTQNFDGNPSNQQFSGVCRSMDRHNRPVYASEPFFVPSSVAWDGSPQFSSSTPCASAPYGTSTTYDVFGRVTQMTMPDNGTVKQSYSGFTTFTTNPRNFTSEATTNELGEVVETRDPPNQGNPGLVVQSWYNAAGNALGMDRDAGHGPTASTAIYDNLGRKIQQTDPDASTLTYSYNAAGEVISQTDAKNQTTAQRYDALGRRWQRVTTGSDGNTLTDTWLFDTAFNGYGQLASETRQATQSSTIKRTFTYDGYGRLSQRSTSVTGQLYNEVTTYDGWGRLQSQQDASGYAMTTSYTGRGFVSGMTDSRIGTLYQVFAMSARGQVTQDQRGGSSALQSAVAFDPATGRLDTVCSGQSCSLQDTKMLFDKVGNLTQRTRARQTAPTTETFQYDPLNRLTQAALTQVMGIVQGNPIITESTSYDALGNICTKNGQSYSYAGRAGCANYGFANSPHAVTAMGGIAYQYDSSGNQTTTSNGRSLSYNGLQQLTSANAPNAQTTFQYAASGEQILRIDGNQPIWPAGCGNAPLNDRVFCNGFDAGGGTTGSLTTTTIGNVEFLQSSTGTLEKRRYLGVAIDYIRPNNANETRFVFADHLGSPEVIANIWGGVYEQLSFDAHGNRRQAQTWQGYAGTALSTTTGFTGHQQVDSVGIIHMRGRVYDPALGRMLQADPLSDPGNQGLNKYTYALNNPLTLTDPTGYFSWNSFLRTAVAIGITVYTGGAAAGAWSFFGTSIAAGSAASVAVAVGGGFAAGAVQSGNLKGAVYGAFSAALFYGVGSYFQGANWAHSTSLSCTAGLTTAGTTAKVLAHGIAGGVMTSLQGGKFGHGFVSAGITESFSGKINNTQSVPGKIIAAAMVGGTASVASGGKFSNGALTSAFAQAFNEGVHEGLIRASQALKSGAISKELYQQSVAPCTGQGGECVATGVGMALGLTGLGAIGLDVAALMAPEAFIGGTAGVTVIGHYPAYVQVADAVGANYFSVAPEVWSTMSVEAQWAANQAFLDAAIVNGNEFVLATSLSEMRAGSFFAQEIQYILSRGYVVDPSKLALVPGVP